MPRLASLFERKRFTRGYPTVRAELAAVRDGTKAIAFDVWPRRELDNHDYRELLAIALEFELAVVHQPAGTQRDADVFVYVLQPEQTWRIQAHQALLAKYLRVNGRWSDGAETFQSVVLGYSDTQIAAHLATIRHERLGWGQQTVFLLLDETQRETVARVGGRYLDPALVDGLELVFATGDRVVRRDAHRLVGDRTLARIALDWRYFRKKFGTDHGKRQLVRIQLARRDADGLNGALEDRVQALGDRGWAPINPRSG